MAQTTKIEWTQATWNPWHGCHKISPGCKNCYMFRDKAKYGQDPNVVVRSKTRFYDPLKWREPRTIFTCSWSDFFIEESDPWRDEAFAIMALTPHHTYQVLTKRPERMWDYCYSFRKTPGRIAEQARELRKQHNITFPDAEFHTEPLGYGDPGAEWYPLKNVWLGVSVEDQKTADERIPILLQTPAALRWLSIEPLLGPVDLERWFCYTPDCNCVGGHDHDCQAQARINWIVAGGESGPNARPMHPDWARSIRDQCTAAGVPFFFKQWGEWLPFEATAQPPFWRDCSTGEEHDAHGMHFFDDRGSEAGTWRGHKWMDPQEAVAHSVEHDAWDAMYLHVGKNKAGRLLDGRTWDEMPTPAAQCLLPPHKSQHARI